MNSDVIRMRIEDAKDDDLINIFGFNNHVQFTKEDCFVDIDDINNILSIYTKKGQVKEDYIDIDSIKHINIIGRGNFGVDPRDMKK